MNASNPPDEQATKPEQRRKMVALEIDADNYIRRLSETWAQVADEGDAAEQLAVDKVLGQPLRHFITSDTTRMQVEASLKLCRIRQQVLFRPYRCDTPTHMRFMELQLTPMAEHAVEMTHFLLRTEPFDTPVYLKEISHTRRKPAGACLRCSFCNRLKPLEQSEWVAPQTLNQSYQNPLKVIHTVCPECKEQTWQLRRQAY